MGEEGVPTEAESLPLKANTVRFREKSEDMWRGGRDEMEGRGVNINIARVQREKHRKGQWATFIAICQAGLVKAGQALRNRRVFTTFTSHHNV